MALREFVAVIGGADPDHPLETQNKPRHLSVGSLIIAIASWAFVASLLAFRSNFHGSWPVAILAAAILASIVFLFDVLVTVVPLKDTTWWSRFKVLCIRALLSLGVGLVVSHATILFIYRDDLSNLVTNTNNAHIAQITQQTIDASAQTPIIKQATAQISNDEGQIRNDNNALVDAKNTLTQLQASWQSDAVCVNGNRAANGDQCGEGPQATRLDQAYESYRDQTLPQIEQTNDAGLKTLRADITTQNATLSTANAKLNKEIAAATAAARNDMGLQAQNDALFHLLSTDWSAWIWPVFFFLIDIAVAFMKAVLPESDYERRRRQQIGLKDAVVAALTNPTAPTGASPHLTEVLTHAAARQAEVTKAVIDLEANRQLAALRQQATRATRHNPVTRAAGAMRALRLPWIRGRRRAAYVVGTMIVAALIAGLITFNHSGSSVQLALVPDVQAVVANIRHFFVNPGWSNLGTMVVADGAFLRDLSLAT